MDFAKLERQLRNHTTRYCSHADYEDAIQEGLIRIWQDGETGRYDERHLIARAHLRIKNILFSDTHYMTGHAAKTREGIEKAEGREAREKIRGFLKTQKTRPSTREIAEATGIPMQSVRAHMRKIDSGWGAKPVLTKEGTNHTDTQAYQTASLDETPYISEGIPSFEDELLSELSYEHLTSGLDPFEKELMDLHFRQDKSYQDISDHFGYLPSYGRGKARKMLFRVIEKVKDEHA